MKTRLEIRHFVNYRTFLQAHAQECRARNPRWSLGGWARKLGLKTTSSLTKILKAQRSAGPEFIEKVFNYFKFSEADRKYFLELVELEKFNSQPEISSLFLKRLQKQHPHGERAEFDPNVFAVISNWHYSTIREMTRLHGFQGSAEEISGRLVFKIDPVQIQEAVSKLLQLGLIEEDSKDGALKYRSGRLSSPSDISSEANRLQHEQMFDLAKKSVRVVDLAERELSGLTLPISSLNVGKAKTLIREFRDRFEELMEEERGDRVYQLQIGFFPLSHSQAQTEGDQERVCGSSA